ncbi:hypothetical protein PHAVU_006G043500 [Phaseolus vulgaris]|uniref:Uncharacterized protein n=1 Tax=Phaseolus vulgaris TaxID=3885 RepID=V7BN53_PHAVU|nr:hypothetical protein PHAVU_006G043500g [Phaseolus vulgaris]ESW18468.1 hypothetical protein PHAVU_006G043500g [Phaseolus vulgaris]
MATSTIKLFNMILFFIFFSQGYSKCSLEDIHVSQAITGLTVKGKPELSVTVANWCSCAQSNVKLDCKGFQSVKSIDPSILKVSGHVCLVNSGNPILEEGVVEFSYAWDTPFSLLPISSDISCA